MAKKSLKLDQESYKREEKRIFHGSEPEILKYIQTLICFANQLGGEIIVEKVEKKDHLKSFFDSAILEKKINAYVEPPISGIIEVSVYNRNKGVKIKIKKSNRAPHFYKVDGCFINSKKEKILVFQRGSIGIRRSGQNDVFNSQDFEILFKEKFSEIFKGVQEIVTKQPIDSLMEIIGRLKSISYEPVSYKYNPKDPAALSIKQILDTEPFTNINEELNASVKLWKTNKTPLSENLIARAYLNADKIKNYEWIELLLLSSLEKQMPAYLWATKLKRSKLKTLLTDIIKRDLHPSTKEAIKLTLALPHKVTKKMIASAKSSRLISVASLIQKISDKIDLKDKDRIDDIKRNLFGGNFYRNLNIEDKNELVKLINEFFNTEKILKAKIKHDWRILDLLIYGGELIKSKK